MLLSTTTYSLQRKGYCYDEIVDICHRAGFDAMDFSFVGEGFFGEETECEAFAQGLLRLKGLAEDHGMTLNQAHAPFRPASMFSETPEVGFKNITRSMKQAAMMGIGTIVVHPLHFTKYCEEGMPEQLFDWNMQFYNALKPYCEEYGIRIAIENMWQRGKRGQRILASACSDPEELCQYIDALDSPFFVACLDIGHAMLNSDPVKCIRTLGSKRLQALHVQDVDGFNDSHTVPYLGVIDWDRVILALKDIGYEGDFTFEAVDYQTFVPKGADLEAAALLAKTGRLLIEKLK